MQFRHLAISIGLLASAFGSAHGVYKPSRQEQQTPLSFIGGAGLPSRLKLADLNDGYKAFRLKLTGAGSSSGGMMNMLMMLGASGSMGGNGNAAMSQLFQSGTYADLYFSTGQTVNYAGQGFLATYHLVSGLSPTSMSAGGPKFAASLHLALVRNDQIVSLEPEPGITPEGLRKSLTDAHYTFDEDAMQAQNMGEGASNTAIEAAIVYPILAQARQAAQRTATLSNSKQIALAMLMYSNDFDDTFPAASSTAQAKNLVAPYVRNKDIWKTLNPAKTKFLYNVSLSGVSMMTIPNPAEVPLVYESGPWPDGSRVVAFTDGHAKRVSADTWKNSVLPWLKHHWKKAPKPKKH